MPLYLVFQIRLKLIVISFSIKYSFLFTKIFLCFLIEEIQTNLRDAFLNQSLLISVFFSSTLVMAAQRYSLNKNKYLLLPETQRLEKILKDYIDKDTRNCLLLTLALKTGGRAQELLNLNKADMNLYDQTLFIRGIKGSNDREIPIAPMIFAQLKNYADSLTGMKLFDISYDRLYQIWNIYRPVPKKFHALRHTFAIQLYQKTKDIRLVQVALGHRNITNTMIYADYVYSQQELRKLIL